MSSSKADLPNVPDSLADLALIDGASIAATAGMSLSKWYSMVSQGAAPQPVIRRSRFTRWRLADARAWLAQLDDTTSPQALAEQPTATLVMTRARAASAKAAEARKAKAANTRTPAANGNDGAKA